jgi:HlyD family secretion protein
MTEQQTVARPPEQDRQTPWNRLKQAVGPRLRRLVILLVLLVAGAGVAFLIWKLFFAKRGVPENVVTLSGRIEGDDSAVAPLTTGRILEMRFREGDSVNAGESIAILDYEQLRDRENQALAALRQAEAKAQSAWDQIAVLTQQLRENQLQMEQAKVDAEGRILQAREEMAAALADLADQEAAYQLALFDRDAYARLARTGAVSERQGKEAASKAAQQAASVAAAKRRYEAACGALATAKANLVNPLIRGAGAEGVRKQITQQQAEIAAANAGADQARPITRGSREPPGPDRRRAVRRHDNDAVRRAWGSGHGRNPRRHYVGSDQGLFAGLHPYRSDRKSQSGAAGARLPRFRSRSPHRSLRLTH